MGTWVRLQKFTTITAGVASGVAIYLYTTTSEKNRIVKNSWTTNTIVPKCSKWDFNWDHREPKSIVQPLPKNATPEAENKYNEKLEAAKPKATRHIILVRHGEYHDRGDSDADKILTELGRRQAKFTGERIKSLKIDWEKVVISTQTRAQETGKIITSCLDKVPVESCDMIREGAPIAPEPPVGHWKPEPSFFKDGARIEAAFRRYFHRADPEQAKSSYTLLVGHGNVIRYFTCRVLQCPPEEYMRLSVQHGSITWISILPSGLVTLHLFGSSGHLPPDLLTYKRVVCVPN